MALSEQRVVVIGGTSGIGLATAQAFLSASAEVVIASRSPEKLEQAQKQLGGKVTARPLDFRDEASRRAFFDQVGSFDHLVITAGDGIMGQLQEVPVEQARSAFDSKFWGQCLTVRSAIPHLHADSSITLTSGVYGLRPPRGAALLAAINSAVEGLVRGLAVELAPMRINAVSPGIVDTPIYAGMSEEQRQDMFQNLSHQFPVGHVAKASEIAEAYVYLAQNTFTTGSVVLIDGGAHLV